MRGARQVGRTWLVRDLAARHKHEILEVNFERSPELKVVIEGASPLQILAGLGLASNRVRYRLLSIPGDLLWRLQELC